MVEAWIVRPTAFKNIYEFKRTGMCRFWMWIVSERGEIRMKSIEKHLFIHFCQKLILNADNLMQLGQQRDHLFKEGLNLTI